MFCSGEMDNICDADFMKRQLPPHLTKMVSIPSYEHLDLIWHAKAHEPGQLWEMVFEDVCRIRIEDVCRKDVCRIRIEDVCRIIIEDVCRIEKGFDHAYETDQLRLRVNECDTLNAPAARESL